MEVKGRNFLILSLFVAVFLVSATEIIGRSERDPEFGVCKYKCEDIRGVEDEEKLGCKQRCEKYRQEKQKREQTEGTGQEKERSYRGGGGGGDTSWMQNGGKGDREFGKGQQSNNPFVFEDRHFTTRLETQQGSLRVLQKFTDRSDIFRGIEKYRVAFLEAEPQTFVIPNHWDADALFFVANGEGTISLINKDSRQNHNIKRGDLFRVPAGISAYLINRHANERLVLAKILHSVSVPGELQTFVGVGGDKPESSFLNAFSTEVLEAAFDTTDRDLLERLFGQQRQEQGMFKKATEEQIRSMSGKDESRTWPFEERKRPYNVYNKKPSVKNENGHLQEVNSDDFSDLRDMNVAFSLFNITQGSMAGPFYNTKTTTVLVVADGTGQFEMVCPHLSERGGGNGSGGPSYERVSSQLRRGTVVVVPAGHPIVIEASGEQELEVIGFGLNSDENEWFPIAGRDNVMSQWEDEAVELTLGVPASEAQEAIQRQKKKLFFQGPVRRGRAFA